LPKQYIKFHGSAFLDGVFWYFSSFANRKTTNLVFYFIANDLLYLIPRFGRGANGVSTLQSSEHMKFISFDDANPLTHATPFEQRYESCVRAVDAEHPLIISPLTYLPLLFSTPCSLYLLFLPFSY
jgi:hypothetical protein